MFVGAGMTAADGRCKTLDSHADGYVRSEACMAILFRCFYAVLPDSCKDNIQGQMTTLTRSCLPASPSMACRSFSAMQKLSLS